MAGITKTIKLHIHPRNEDISALRELTEAYRKACNHVSKYIFDSGFPLSFLALNKQNYHYLREEIGLKSQFAQSVSKTVIARYRTVKEQLAQKPYKYRDESRTWQYVSRTLEWLWKPVRFSRPQADFVRGRDYSFVTDRKTGSTVLSVNILQGRISSVARKSFPDGRSSARCVPSFRQKARNQQNAH